MISICPLKRPRRGCGLRIGTTRTWLESWSFTVTLYHLFDWLGFSPHTRSIPHGTTAPIGAVPSELSARPLGCVLREHGVPEGFELLAIGPSFDAADAITSMDWHYFRPRLVLVDNRAPGQQSALRLLESVGWRRAHWGAMYLWYVRRSDLAGFRRERILLAMRSFLWALKRVFPLRFLDRQKFHE